MSDLTRLNFPALDHPSVTGRLFHPRPDSGVSRAPSATDLMIQVAPDAAIGARFHMGSKAFPSLLFFHGNGEIVSDYDDLGPMYNRIGVNLLAVDYRGYGRSTGRPGVTAIMRDAHVILDFTMQWLSENGYFGPLSLMGRSLGSAPVLELAAARPEDYSALIIESGFAWAGPLLELLGVKAAAMGYDEETGFNNLEKMRKVTRPTLIIHGRRDDIIPFEDGKALGDACGAVEKRLLEIPNAGHNDLLYRGFGPYMEAIADLLAPK